MTFPETSWTAETLAPRLGGARGSSAADTLAEVERLLTVAVELLEDACVVTFRTIPQHTADEMVLKTVRALWDSRKTASGQQFTEQGAEAGPRAPRDPLAPSEALLARYVVPL